MHSIINGRAWKNCPALISIEWYNTKGRLFKQSLAVVLTKAIFNFAEAFFLKLIFVNNVETDESQKWKDIYLTESTLLLRIPEAGCCPYNF